MSCKCQCCVHCNDMCNRCTCIRDCAGAVASKKNGICTRCGKKHECQLHQTSSASERSTTTLPTDKDKCLHSNPSVSSSKSACPCRSNNSGGSSLPASEQGESRKEGLVSEMDVEHEVPTVDTKLETSYTRIIPDVAQSRSSLSNSSDIVPQPPRSNATQIDLSQYTPVPSLYSPSQACLSSEDSPPSHFSVSPQSPMSQLSGTPSTGDPSSPISHYISPVQSETDETSQ